jgi:hypothetical protein
MKRILPLVVGSFAVTLAACGGSSGPLAGKTAQQVLTAALAAAKTSGSVHYSVVGKDAGHTETIVGGASDTSGNEVVTAGDVTIEALVVGKAVFVKGDAGGLEDEMGLAASIATSNAGKWISIASTDRAYSSLTKGVSLDGVLKNLEPTGHLTLTAPTTKDGQSVVGVRGALPSGLTPGTKGSTVLYVAAANPTVPLVLNVDQSMGAQKSTAVGTYGSWGKPVDLVAPTSAVPFSSLGAG